MGTASTKKVIKQVAGVLTEEAALRTTAGAGDADRIPALNASGLIDDTMMNANAASANNAVVKRDGSGLIDYTSLRASTAGATGGGADANKLLQLDASGKISSTALPAGVGADTVAVTASEALAAGDLVNIYNNSSVANCRKADGSTTGKEAHGFVLAAVSNAATATIYMEGSNTQMTSLTPGNQFLSATTPGKTTTTAPSTAGQTVQQVGFAVSATQMNFQSGTPITLA